MKQKVIRKIAGFFIVSAIFSTSLTGQTRNDVIKLYNEGAKASKTDLPASIKAFESAVTIAEQVGEEADDLKQKAMQVLPGLYFRVAYNALNEKKPAPEIIKAAKEAIGTAEKYESATNKANAEKILVQAYNTMGTEYFTQNDYDNALLTFDSLLVISPGSTSALYNKALIYIRQDDADSFEGTIDLLLENLTAANDEERTKQVSTLALEYFRRKGSEANQADELDEALTLLDKSAKYGDDKDLFYYFADVYNKKEDYDKGLEYAQKGLDLETGDAEAKAKFYFQLAMAQMGKGETANACASFQNALYGPFEEPSKVQRSNLKCE